MGPTGEILTNGRCPVKQTGGQALSADRSDWLGIGLALGSSLALAVYMILIRHQMPGEAVLVVHLVALCLVSGMVSLLLGESWDQWRVLTLFDWFVFAAFSLGVLLGANLGQIESLRHLGAPLVSSMLAWRLVSTLLVAALLLNERLTSPWQVLGAVIVLITITWYLRRQRPGAAVRDRPQLKGNKLR